MNKARIESVIENLELTQEASPGKNSKNSKSASSLSSSSTSSDSSSSDKENSETGILRKSTFDTNADMKESEGSDSKDVFRQNSSLRLRRESKNLTTNPSIGPLKTNIGFNDQSLELESPDLAKFFVDSPLVNLSQILRKEKQDSERNPGVQSKRLHHHTVVFTGEKTTEFTGVSEEEFNWRDQMSMDEIYVGEQQIEFSSLKNISSSRTTTTGIFKLKKFLRFL